MIGFEAFKGRSVTPGERVQVYRKIVGGKVHGPLVWSIRGPEGLVRGHARAVALYDAYAYVNVAAAERIRQGGVREVHAWIRGSLAGVVPIIESGARNWQQVTYQPHNAGVFFDVETRETWTGPAEVVTFNDRGMYV